MRGKADLNVAKLSLSADVGPAPASRLTGWSGARPRARDTIWWKSPEDKTNRASSGTHPSWTFSDPGANDYMLGDA